METLITITWPSWLVVRAKDHLVLNQYTCQTERKNLNRTGEKKILLNTVTIKLLVNLLKSKQQTKNPNKQVCKMKLTNIYYCSIMLALHIKETIADWPLQSGH